MSKIIEMTNVLTLFHRDVLCSYDVRPPSEMTHNFAEQSSLPEAIRLSLWGQNAMSSTGH
jgi:hypothetical protein